MSELRGAMIIGQSGGPSSVINASCYGAIKAGLDSDVITKVYGAANGIVGVLNDKLYVMDEEDPEELAIMRYTPSSALGSCRYKIADPDVDDTDYKKILEIFKKYDVRYFFYNGGNDSMDTCNKISKYMKKVGYDCRVNGYSQNHRQRPVRNRPLPRIFIRCQVHCHLSGRGIPGCPCI